MTDSPYALTWPVTPLTGWGKLGLALLDDPCGRPRPVLLQSPVWSHFEPDMAERLRPLAHNAAELEAFLRANPGAQANLSPLTVLHAFGNGLGADDAMLRARGVRNIALAAFEETVAPPDRLARLADMDAVIVHSSYALGLMRGWGVKRLALAFQGVDTDLFRPRPRTGQFGDRFVVFSGGKLEFRKGQDLVLAAFARFRQRHPDSLLVCAWGNFWPQTAFSINEGGHLAPLLPQADGTPDLRRWIADAGVPEQAVHLLEHYAPAGLAAVLADCDVALFPNRCEGCTNLVAMEAMACGVPAVLSANTGHLDLIVPGRVMPLHRQQPVADPDGTRLGWGESSIDEMVAALEHAYCHRDEAGAVGLSGAAMIRDGFTWKRFAATTAAIIDRADPGDAVRSDAVLPPFDLAARRLADGLGDVAFLQVGGFDGVSFDPLRPHIQDPRWHGAIVEPMPEPFAKLRALYGDEPRIRLVNCALSEEAGQRPMWRFKSEAVADGRLHPGYGGMSSFLLQDLLAEGGSIQAASGFGAANMDYLRTLIEPVPVRCAPMPMVIAEAGLDRIDLLQIDAEGYDLAILQAFDFSRYRPWVIQYENQHLGAEGAAQAEALLQRQGYRVQACAENTLAVLRQPLV
jgi:FkbM family methyltransferase